MHYLILLVLASLALCAEDNIQGYWLYEDLGNHVVETESGRVVAVSPPPHTILHISGNQLVVFRDGERNLVFTIKYFAKGEESWVMLNGDDGHSKILGPDSFGINESGDLVMGRQVFVRITKE